MSSDPPPPYPGGPAAPLMEEKRGQPPFSENVPTVNQPMGTHFPPSECGPPPYEPSMHPGQVPPHIPSEGGIAYPPPGYYPPPGQFPTPGPYPPPPGQFQPVGAHTPALIVPAATTTTVTVLQGEVFQAAPVHTVCPHCQQAIITKISYEIGLMNTLFCLFCCFVGYGVWPYNFFKKLNIPGPTPFPFIGTFHHLRKGFFNFDLECMQKYGQIWGFYDGRQPVIGLVDTSMIKTIWVKECYSTFTNRRNFRLNGKLDTALTVVEDEQWKRIRSVLSPNFTSGRLKEMLPIMKQHRDVLIKNLQKKANANEPVQLKEFFGAYSLDVIGSTSFSVDIDSLNHPNEPFVMHMKKALKFSFFNPLLIMAVIFPWIIPVLEKMDFTLFPHDTVNFFADAVKSIKEKKKKGDSNERVDFLQMMMDSQLSDKNLVSNGVDHTYKALTDDEIVAQSVLFIIAGYETTSTALTYLAYNLALHPDVQQKLQQEIDDTFPDKASLTYDGLMQMEYLDMVINESMRLYPNGGRAERISSKTVEINGVTIPKGTVIMVPLYALHRHPNHWPDPEEFRPERFSKENRETMDPYAYMPFGTGPRNCIGMRFALLNMKLALTSVLQKFSFEPCKETQIPLKISPMGLMTPEPPVILRLVPRPNAKTAS